jgi:hypothetical protein
VEILISLGLVVIGLGCAGLGIWRFVQRYEALQGQKLAMAATAGSSKSAVAVAKQQVQNLSERVAAITSEAAALEAKAAEIEKTLSLPEREQRPAFYIATDSIADGRTAFRATIRCTGPTPAFTGERDYVLWTRDIDRARLIFAQRFDAKAGFVVGPVATHPDVL